MATRRKHATRNDEVPLALTFDDVLLLPAHSEVHPREVDLRTSREQSLSAAQTRLDGTRNTIALMLHQLAALPADLAHRGQVQALLAASRDADLDRASSAEREKVLAASTTLLGTMLLPPT